MTALSRLNAINNYRQKRGLDSAHAGLLFDKYKTLDDEGKEEVAKKSLVYDTARVAKISDSYKKFFTNWQTKINSLAAKDIKNEDASGDENAVVKSSYCIEQAMVKVKGRMLIGVGEESTIETAITIHHSYGLPYIPGSSLKGLASAYAHKYLGPDEAIWRKGDKDGNHRGDAQEAIFGSTEQAGDVIFFDALPNPNHKPNESTTWADCWLVPDIITVHHQDYYSNKDNPPADWDDPNPIPLLSAVGEYWLVVAGKDENAVKAAFNLLKFGLQYEGVGAKTAIGYGKMASNK